MGHLTGGPYYDMIGRTGNNVGRKVKGKNVFSMRPAKSNKAPTALQRAQRQKFALVTHWLSWIADLIEANWMVHRQDESPMNAAVSYHLLNAVTGTAPNFAIKYPKVMFSRGKVGEASNPFVNATVKAEIAFSWSAGVSSKYLKPTDMATVMVYNAKRNQFVTVQRVVPRSELKYNLLLPGDFSGEEVDCYIAFSSADGKMAGNSTFIIRIPVL